MIVVADRLIPENRNSHRLPPFFMRAAWESVMTELDILRSFLRYDADSGNFFWIEKPSPRVRPGLKAGYVNGHGYVMIGLHGKRYGAHRIAWAMSYGNFPDPNLFVDHVNGVKSDNSLKNLRILTNTENQQNRHKPNIRSKTGVTGVQWRPLYGHYQVRIMLNGKRIDLGCYKTLEEAIQARHEGERKHHPFSNVTNIIADQFIS